MSLSRWARIDAGPFRFQPDHVSLEVVVTRQVVAPGPVGRTEDGRAWQAVPVGDPIVSRYVNGQLVEERGRGASLSPKRHPNADTARRTEDHE